MKKIVIGLTIVFSAIANADNLSVESIERDSESCLEGKFKTSDLLECISSDMDSWDKLLNQSYIGLMGALDSEQKTILKNTQRAWIKYKDLEYKNIESLLKNMQGTMYYLVESDRKKEIIKERAIQLTKHLATVTSA